MHTLNFLMLPKANGDLTIRWEFGDVLRKLASNSDLYVTPDSAALLAMRSRYAITRERGLGLVGEYR